MLLQCCASSSSFISTYLIPFFSLLAVTGTLIVYAGILWVNRKQLLSHQRQNDIQEQQLAINDKEIELQRIQTEIQKKQLEYSEKQLVIQKQQFLPKIIIRNRLEKTQDHNIYDTEFLEIFNEGFFISNFSCQITVLYYFEEYNNRIFKKRSVHFKVNGYYTFVSKPTERNNQKGKLQTCYDLRNNEHFFKLYQKAIQSSKDNLIYKLEKYSLLKISYDDFEGGNHTKYYVLSFGDYEVPIDEYEAELALAIPNELREYSTLTLQDLQGLLDKYGN